MWGPMNNRLGKMAENVTSKKLYELYSKKGTTGLIGSGIMVTFINNVVK